MLHASIGAEVGAMSPFQKNYDHEVFHSDLEMISLLDDTSPYMHIYTTSIGCHLIF
jgi:hypothetical protein